MRLEFPRRVFTSLPGVIGEVTALCDLIFEPVPVTTPVTMFRVQNSGPWEHCGDAGAAGPAWIRARIGSVKRPVDARSRSLTCRDRQPRIEEQHPASSTRGAVEENRAPARHSATG